MGNANSKAPEEKKVSDVHVPPLADLSSELHISVFLANNIGPTLNDTVVYFLPKSSFNKQFCHVKCIIDYVAENSCPIEVHGFSQVHHV